MLLSVVAAGGEADTHVSTPDLWVAHVSAVAFRKINETSQKAREHASPQGHAFTRRKPKRSLALLIYAAPIARWKALLQEPPPHPHWMWEFFGAFECALKMELAKRTPERRRACARHIQSI